IEREPAWSPDGERIAFASNSGKGFDIVVATVRTGAVTTEPTMNGDERWPSWTPDGRLVFAHRAQPAAGHAGDPSRQWALYLVATMAGPAAWHQPVPLTHTKDSGTYLRVSPDGMRVAFVSERDEEDDVNLWWLPVPEPGVQKPRPLGTRRPDTAKDDASSDAKDAAPKATRIT